MQGTSACLLEGRQMISHLGAPPCGNLGERQGGLASRPRVIGLGSMFFLFYGLLLVCCTIVYVTVALLPKYMTIIVIGSV